MNLRSPLPKCFRRVKDVMNSTGQMIQFSEIRLGITVTTLGLSQKAEKMWEDTRATPESDATTVSVSKIIYSLCTAQTHTSARGTTSKWSAVSSNYVEHTLCSYHYNEQLQQLEHLKFETWCFNEVWAMFQGSLWIVSTTFGVEFHQCLLWFGSGLSDVSCGLREV